MMTCKRCGGLMQSILLRDRSCYTGLPAYRCLICSEITDEVITRNQRSCERASRPRGRRRARPGGVLGALNRSERALMLGNGRR